ncbi:MAG: sugar ABC transporter ATP-binding protein, partial [Cyclobacteriaceae bacterium]
MSRLTINDISKSFPGVKALQHISFDVSDGEVHALCGENGAGKSTLMNILSGNLQPDQGSITLNNEKIILLNPQQAFAHGISIVYQHLSLAENLSVAENVFANQHPTNRFGVIQYGELFRRTKELLQRLHIELKPQTPLLNLSAAEKQMVEIAKALSRYPQLLILDEPTASLTEKETTTLFRIIRELKQQGVSIIYISHRLQEIEQIADRVSILKDGSYHGTFLRGEISREELIRRMVGRTLLKGKRTPRSLKEVLLESKELSGKGFRKISFELRKGEILGLAGLIGAGSTEIAKAIFGIESKTGDVLIHSKRTIINQPADALRKGIAYLPEERKRLALFPDMSITDNIVSAKLELSRNMIYNDNECANLARQFIKVLRITSTSEEQKTSFLSGGNQQKVVLARWLATNPEILIVDEPTHGIDVGSREVIYNILKNIALEGKGVIVISSELPELLALCHRILILKAGSLVGELSSEDASEEKITALATN